MTGKTQKKVLLYYPQWGNRWIPYIEGVLSEYDLMVFNVPSNAKVNLKELHAASEPADILISMWCDGVVGFWANEFPDKKIISYLRRYEIWEDLILNNVKFDNIDAMIFVSKYYENKFRDMMKDGPLPEKTYVIPNGIDMSGFELSVNKRDPHKIAMVCTIKNVKNIPLAAQILYHLPQKYKIYHIGIPFSSQITGQILSYIDNLGVRDRFIFEGCVDAEKVSAWLDDKSIILSTSINEGNPNNILEAMAKGIKPVIHNWPGAKEQFPSNYVFDTAEQAIEMIESSYYKPIEYRSIVEERYGIENFKKIHGVISDVCGFKSATGDARLEGCEELNAVNCSNCGTTAYPRADGATIKFFTCNVCGAWNKPTKVEWAN